MHHTFRYPSSNKAERGDGDNNKIRAQMLLRAVLIDRHRKFIDPRTFLVEKCNFDADAVTRLDRTSTNNAAMTAGGGASSATTTTTTTTTTRMRELQEAELRCFEELEKSLQATAAADDERIERGSN